MPTTWWDVLTLDLDIDGLANQRTLRSFVSIFGTFLAFVRPTIPGHSPRWLRQLFPAIAWFFFSDESTVRHKLWHRAVCVFVYLENRDDKHPVNMGAATGVGI